MARSWLARLARRTAAAVSEPFAPRGALRHSTSSGGSGGGAAAASSAAQAPPAALGPIAQLQQAQLHGAHAAPGTLGKPVVVPVGALVLTGAALLSGGLVLGALTEKLHRQSEAPRQANGSSGSGSNRGSGTLLSSASSSGESPIGGAGSGSQPAPWAHLSLAGELPGHIPALPRVQRARPAGGCLAPCSVAASACCKCLSCCRGPPVLRHSERPPHAAPPPPCRLHPLLHVALPGPRRRRRGQRRRRRRRAR